MIKALRNVWHQWIPNILKSVWPLGCTNLDSWPLDITHCLWVVSSKSSTSTVDLREAMVKCNSVCPPICLECKAYILTVPPMNFSHCQMYTATIPMGCLGYYGPLDWYHKLPLSFRQQWWIIGTLCLDDFWWTRTTRCGWQHPPQIVWQRNVFHRKSVVGNLWVSWHDWYPPQLEKIVGRRRQHIQHQENVHGVLCHDCFGCWIPICRLKIIFFLLFLLVRMIILVILE